MYYNFPLFYLFVQNRLIFFYYYFIRNRYPTSHGGIFESHIIIQKIFYAYYAWTKCSDFRPKQNPDRCTVRNVSHHNRPMVPRSKSDQTSPIHGRGRVIVGKIGRKSTRPTMEILKLIHIFNVVSFPRPHCSPSWMSSHRDFWAAADVRRRHAVVDTQVSTADSLRLSGSLDSSLVSRLSPSHASAGLTISGWEAHPTDIRPPPEAPLT